MTELYFDIRNGDVYVQWDDKGNFVYADVIKCGEWWDYNSHEESEFMDLMKWWHIDLDEIRKEKLCDTN